MFKEEMSSNFREMKNTTDENRIDRPGPGLAKPDANSENIGLSNIHSTQVIKILLKYLITHSQKLSSFEKEMEDMKAQFDKV